MESVIVTDLDEIPRGWRRSKYDWLIRHVDSKVVVIPRGSIDGFGQKTPIAVVRAALNKWARSRGLQIELRYIWVQYPTDEPFEYRLGGRSEPWGVYVKVRSAGGRGASKELLEQLGSYYATSD